MKDTIDYNLKDVPLSFWKKVRHEAIDLEMSIRKLILDALKEKIRKKKK